MNIRSRLTLLFLALSFTILVVCFILILYTQKLNREDLYHERLEVKARNVERLFVENNSFGKNHYRLSHNNTLTLHNEQIFIINDADSLLFVSTSGLLQYLPSKELIQEAKNSTVYFFDWQKLEYCALRSGTSDNPITIIVAGLDQYGHVKIEKLQNLLFLLFGFSLIISTLVGWFFSGRVLAPVNKIISQVDAITAGNLNVRLEEGNKKDELARLAITFNQMLNRIQDAFAAQRAFIANASHELRTPLTVISGRLELALIRGKNNEEEYRTAIIEVMDDIRNLNQIFSSLLILAQVQNNREKASFIMVRMDELIWQVRTEYLRRNNKTLIDVKFEKLPEEDKDLMVLGNEHLLKTVVINLIDNAVKFTSENSVDIQIDFNSDEFSMKFSDHGQGISLEEIKKITQPFYRGKESSGLAGYGLGLAMVERIVKLHDGRLEIASIPGKGSSITVFLPKNKPIPTATDAAM